MAVFRLEPYEQGFGPQRPDGGGGYSYMTIPESSPDIPPHVGTHANEVVAIISGCRAVRSISLGNDSITAHFRTEARPEEVDRMGLQVAHAMNISWTGNKPATRQPARVV